MATNGKNGKGVVRAEDVADATLDAMANDIRTADGTPAAAPKARQANQEAKQEAATQPVPKSKSAGKGGGKGQSKKATMTAKEQANVAKMREKAKQKAAKLKADKAAKREKERAEREAAHKAQAEQREKQKAEREAARLEARQKREQAAQEKAAEKQRQAEAMAQLQEDTRALALRPSDVIAQAPDFLNIPGVELREVGLILPDELSVQDWTKVVSGLVGYSTVAGWALGDALRYGENSYQDTYKPIMAALDLEYSTVKNYVLVARAFPIEERVSGVPITHHLEVAALYKSDPATARNLLERARDEGLSAAMLRQLVREARGVTGPQNPRDSKLSADWAEVITLATNEQRERDYEAAQSPEHLARMTEQDTAAILHYARQASDFVPAEAVIRVVSRLQVRIQDLQREVQDLRAQLANREEANARIISGEVVAREEDLVWLPNSVTPEEDVIDIPTAEELGVEREGAEAEV